MSITTKRNIDRATLLKRADEVLALRLTGAEFPDIMKHAEAQGWNVSERQVWRYIRHGDRLLEKTLEKDRLKLVNRHIAQRRQLYARALSVSDYGTCLRILQDEAELLNLYPPKQTRLGLPEGGVMTLNIVEELVVNAAPQAALPAPPPGEVIPDEHSNDAARPATAEDNQTPQSPGGLSGQ